MKKQKTSIVWLVILILFFIYLLYQSAFAWNEQVSMPDAGDSIPKDKTAFVIVKDTHLFVQSSGIKAVEDSLEMWNYDKKQEKVILKHENLLPQSNTQMMLIYDKGHDSFERHTEVLSLLKFPYEHYYKKENIFSVNGVAKNGDIYMTYKNQRVHLAPGEKYRTFSTEGYKFTITTIENYGLYDKNQFMLKETMEKEKKAKKENKPEQIDVQHIESKPLEVTKPVYDEEESE